MIIFVIVMALICAGILVYDKPIFKKKKSKPLKYTIPASFWDDYNHCIHSISKMKQNDMIRVENLIDNLMYQYVELIDTNTYIEKISYLVELYNKKVKSFLLTNQLN
jgi:hypothetical protein